MLLLKTGKSFLFFFGEFKLKCLNRKAENNKTLAVFLYINYFLLLKIQTNIKLFLRVVLKIYYAQNLYQKILKNVTQSVYKYKINMF
jgi:hypothetical protein